MGRHEFPIILLPVPDLFLRVFTEDVVDTDQSLVMVDIDLVLPPYDTDPFSNQIRGHRVPIAFVIHQRVFQDCLPDRAKIGFKDVTGRKRL